MNLYDIDFAASPSSRNRSVLPPGQDSWQWTSICTFVLTRAPLKPAKAGLSGSLSSVVHKWATERANENDSVFSSFFLAHSVTRTCISAQSISHTHRHSSQSRQGAGACFICSSQWVVWKCQAASHPGGSAALQIRSPSCSSWVEWDTTGRRSHSKRSENHKISLSLSFSSLVRSLSLVLSCSLRLFLRGCFPCAYCRYLNNTRDMVDFRSIVCNSQSSSLWLWFWLSLLNDWNSSLVCWSWSALTPMEAVPFFVHVNVWCTCICVKRFVGSHRVLFLMW